MGPRDKQVVFASRAELGLTPQMDVRPYAYGLGVCGSAVVPCCGVWVALELSCLATLLSLELEGSREGILYDEM